MFTLDCHPCETVSDMKAVRADGVLVGYCSIVPGKDIPLICRFSESEVEQIKELITNEIGEPGEVNWPRNSDVFSRYRNGVQQNRSNGVSKARDKARRDSRKGVPRTKSDGS